MIRERPRLDALIEKPWTRDDLRQRVATVLSTCDDGVLSELSDHAVLRMADAVLSELTTDQPASQEGTQ